MAIDPVCGMRVEQESATASATFEGQHYYFCCTGCRDLFVANPAGYLNKRSQRRQLAGLSTVVPCIRQSSITRREVSAMRHGAETGTCVFIEARQY